MQLQQEQYTIYQPINPTHYEIYPEQFIKVDYNSIQKFSILIDNLMEQQENNEQQIYIQKEILTIKNIMENRRWIELIPYLQICVYYGISIDDFYLFANEEIITEMDNYQYKHQYYTLLHHAIKQQKIYKFKNIQYKKFYINQRYETIKQTLIEAQEKNHRFNIIDLCNCNQIDNEISQFLQDTDSLILSGVNTDFVTDSLGSKLKQLRTLKLSWFYSPISDLFFRNMTNLYSLDLSGTRINIGDKLFKNMKNLKILNLAFLRRTRITDDFCKHLTLEKLNIMECYWFSDRLADHLGSLKILQMSRCSQSYITDYFGQKLVSLQQLNMTECLQSTITSGFFINMKKLFGLSMSCDPDNQQKIKQILQIIPDIKELHIDFCYLDDKFKNQQLFRDFKNIKYLDIQNIQSDIDDSFFANLPQLMNLNISNCEFNKITDKVFKYNHLLQYLNIYALNRRAEKNKITSGISQYLQGLKSLTISDEIYVDDQFFMKLSHVQSLKITGFRGIPLQFTQLKSLHIYGTNQIVYLQDMLKYTPNLEQLYMESASFLWDENKAMYKLLYLKDLSIYRCHFLINNEFFRMFPNLQYLDITNCSKCNIDEGMFHYIPNIVQLTFHKITKVFQQDILEKLPDCLESLYIQYIEYDGMPTNEYKCPDIQVWFIDEETRKRNKQKQMIHHRKTVELMLLFLMLCVFFDEILKRGLNKKY